MRAVVFDRYGGPEVLRVGEVPEPHAGPGQVRITVAAASINRVDVKIRSGALAGGAAAEGTTVTGYDAAGVVDEVGEGVTGVDVGNEVFGTGQGTHAEHAVLQAWTGKPDAMGWSEAGALGVIGETAARGLTLLGVGQGTTVFVDGASGGVGKIAVQLAVARGARVIGSASPGKRDVVAALGAEPVGYGEDVGTRVQALAATVDGVFDTAGKTPVDVLVGLVASPHDVVTIANFTAPDSGIRVTTGADGTDPSASLAEVADLYREGKLSVQVDSVLPFAQAGVGQQAAESGTTKVVLVP
ncbi:MAG: NADP-dependent oxidoreductase [Propionibacteriaceae bacterium]